MPRSSDQMLGKNRHSDIPISVEKTMTHHGLLGSLVLKLAFSNGRTFCNMKRITICSVIPT